MFMQFTITLTNIPVIKINSEELKPDKTVRQYISNIYMHEKIG